MIELTGSVTISVDGEAARIAAAQRHLVVDVDNPRAFVQALRGPATPGGGGSPLALLRQIAARLAQAGLTVRIVSRGSVVVTLGRDVRPGLASRLVGSPYVAPGSPVGLLRLLGL